MAEFAGLPQEPASGINMETHKRETSIFFSIRPPHLLPITERRSKFALLEMHFFSNFFDFLRRQQVKP
jgi:hypothetical protein